MNSKFFKKQKKILKSFSLYNINSKNNSNINRFNSTEKVKNLKKIKTIKKHFSFRKNVNNRFYKLLRNYNNNSWSKYKKRASPNIIDKNTFNFSLKDENNDILIRTINIEKGNRKHILYSSIASKREREKIREAKEFHNKMKIIESNLKIIKKNNLDEKRKMKELMMIRKIKKLNSKPKNYDIKSYILKNDKNLMSKQSTKRKEKVMNKFEEIMKKIKQKNN